MKIKIILILMILITTLKPLQSEINGSLKDECKSFFSFIEDNLNRDGSEKIWEMMVRHNENNIWKILDWCSKHKLIKIK